MYIAISRETTKIKKSKIDMLKKGNKMESFHMPNLENTKRAKTNEHVQKVENSYKHD